MLWQLKLPKCTNKSTKFIFLLKIKQDEQQGGALYQMLLIQSSQQLGNPV